MGKTAAADGKHFGRRYPAILYYSDIGRAATNIHHDASEVRIGIVAQNRAANRKWFYRYGQ